jgi:HEAT repeat protein
MRSIQTTSAHVARICLLVLLGHGFSESDTPTTDPWKLLNEGAQEKSADKRAQAVSALGLIPGNPQAIKLTENALQDSNSAVRNAAVSALAEMGAKSSIPKIKALLTNSDAQAVVVIAAALKQLNDPEGYEIYYEILTGRRKGSGGILAGIKDRKAVEKMGIEEALGFVPFASIGIGAYDYIKTNTSLTVNAVAATALALDPDPAAEKALVQATFDSKEVVKVAALRALAKRGDPAVVTDIAHQMYSDKSVVCYTAAAAVVHLTDEKGKRRWRLTR